MPDWGEIFAAPAMQGLQPNPEFLALLPELKRAGVRRVLDAGCGVGRQLLPLAQHGFQVVGVDREAGVLPVLKRIWRPRLCRRRCCMADLQALCLCRRALRPGSQHQCHQPRGRRHLSGLLPGAGPGSEARRAPVYQCVAPNLRRKGEAAPDPGTGARHPGEHRHAGRRTGAPFSHPRGVAGPIPRLWRAPPGNHPDSDSLHGQCGAAPAHFLGDEKIDRGPETEDRRVAAGNWTQHLIYLSVKLSIFRY